MKERHPKGLYVLFATEMWERFSFYTMLAMLTLYLQDPKEGFGWSKASATGHYANYLMFVYSSPLIGGWIADRKLGFRKTITIGGLFFIAGQRAAGRSRRSSIVLRPALGICSGDRQRLLQAEHLDDGGQPLPEAEPAPRLGVQHLLYGHQCRSLGWAPARGRGVRQRFGFQIPEAGQQQQAPRAPEQAASLRGGFLAAFVIAAGRDGHRQRPSSSIFWTFQRAARRRGRHATRAGRLRAARVIEDTRSTWRRGAEGPDRQGPREDADRRASRDLRHRRRVLDGIPPERQHAHLLGQRQHGLGLVEGPAGGDLDPDARVRLGEGRLGGRLQLDQSVLDRRALVSRW